MKGCAVDIHPRVFNPGDAFQSNLAAASVIMWQLDLVPTYNIMVRASFASYLWKWLLDAGADVHVADTLSGESLLHYAARAPTADAVKVALAAGAHVGRRSGVGVPTDVSEAYDEGQEPRREDLRGGLTPLMAAAIGGHEQLAMRVMREAVAGRADPQ